MSEVPLKPAKSCRCRCKKSRMTACPKSSARPLHPIEICFITASFCFTFFFSFTQQKRFLLYRNALPSQTQLLYSNARRFSIQRRCDVVATSFIPKLPNVVTTSLNREGSMDHQLDPCSNINPGSTMHVDVNWRARSLGGKDGFVKPNGRFCKANRCFETSIQPTTPDLHPKNEASPLFAPPNRKAHLRFASMDFHKVLA